MSTLGVNTYLKEGAGWVTLDCTAKVTEYAVTNYNETMKSVSALLNQTHYDLHEVYG